MYFLLSLSILSFVLFVFAIQIHSYNQLEKDRYRFEYFAIRDELRLLVCKKIISEDSWEYKTLINAINFHINAVDSLSIVRIARLLADYHTSKDEDRAVKLIQKKIESPEIIKLTIDFLGTTRNLLYRNSRAQIWLVNFLKKSNQVQRKTVTSRPDIALKRIDRNLDELTHSLNGISVA